MKQPVLSDGQTERQLCMNGYLVSGYWTRGSIALSLLWVPQGTIAPGLQAEQAVSQASSNTTEAEQESGQERQNLGAPRWLPGPVQALVHSGCSMSMLAGYTAPEDTSSGAMTWPEDQSRRARREQGVGGLQEQACSLPDWKGGPPSPFTGLNTL